MNNDLTIPARVLRAGALYDLAVTLPFATPWSAAWVLGALQSVHAALSLPGSLPGSYEPAHMLFVNMLGSIVSIWALARLRNPSRENGALDTLGRAGFSFAMIYALGAGASGTVAAFLALELSFFVGQAWAVWRMAPQRLAA
jgi:hypothetical protein